MAWYSRSWVSSYELATTYPAQRRHAWLSHSAAVRAWNGVCLSIARSRAEPQRPRDPLRRRPHLPSQRRDAPDGQAHRRTPHADRREGVTLGIAHRRPHGHVAALQLLVRGRIAAARHLLDLARQRRGRRDRALGMTAESGAGHP